jgi:hypothetical protein
MLDFGLPAGFLFLFSSSLMLELFVYFFCVTIFLLPFLHVGSAIEELEEFFIVSCTAIHSIIGKLSMIIISSYF